jgi:uncharacterized coiled-coil DUF342 family protein
MMMNYQSMKSRPVRRLEKIIEAVEWCLSLAVRGSNYQRELKQYLASLKQELAAEKKVVQIAN